MLRSLFSSLLLITCAASAYCQTPFILNTDVNQVDAGGSAFSNNVNGSGFVTGSVAYWGVNSLATTFISSGQLGIIVPAGLIAVSGKYNVTVKNPNGVVSNAFPIQVFPLLKSLFPTGAAMGLPSATVVLNGVGFTPSDAILTPQGPIPTTYISSTMLSGVLPASLLSKPVEMALSVGDNIAGVFSRQTLLFTVGNPPILASLSPPAASMGDPGFTLTINGSGLLPGAVASWNGSPIPTVFVSPTRLTATVLPGLLTLPGAAPAALGVFVTNPDGGLSNTLIFTVRPPTPVLTSITPNSVFAGAPGFTLSLNGAGFYDHSVVWFNGFPVPTNFVSSNLLTAAVPASSISTAGDAAIYVFNEGYTVPGVASNRVLFSVLAPNLDSVTPASVRAASQDFVLTANGSGFFPGHMIRWNGLSLATTYISPTQLSAPVTAQLVKSAGTAAVTVVSPAGAASQSVNFAILPLVPALSSVSPSSITAGSPTFTLTAQGSNFVNGARVQWNSSPLATTFQSDTELTATVPAGLIGTQGSVAVSVVSPGGLSNPVAFSILPSVPAAATSGVVNAANSSAAIAPGSLISIYGANLATTTAQADGWPLPVALKGSSFTINGRAAPLLYVGSTQINGQVPFEVPPGPAKLVISVNGTTSDPIPFTVTATGPATFTMPGTNHAVAQNLPEYTLNSMDSPATPGQYITAYVTGQGLVDNPVETGAPAPSTPLSVPVAPIEVRIGGQPAEVAFAGLAPGFAGLMQLNLKIPPIGPGEQILEVRIGTASANSTTISVASRQ
jgi:uncharacterized protein (TIGR03437 family)